jgi:hypothetical protein
MVDISSQCSFLVPPGKNLATPPETRGTLLALDGNLHRMLSDLFRRSDHECDIPIRFLRHEDGSQHNVVRSMLLDYIASPDLSKGKALADRLRDFTTNVPGLGLLFLILGRDDGTRERKVVLCRFPADVGMLAEPEEGGLRVEFIERIFMKNPKKYKAAVYRGISLEGGFWSGLAVDRQLNAPDRQIADYWIHDFLASDFLTTSKAGSKRFGIAIRVATKAASSLEVQQELVRLRLTARRFAGQVTSIDGLGNTVRLSDEARRAIAAALPNEDLMNDQFVLDDEEFVRYSPLTSVRLDSGGLMIAPSDSFDDVFRRQAVDEASDLYQFVAEGTIVEETLRGGR